jgi:hypothetical protein
MDSEGFVAGNSNHTGRRFYMGFKSCDAWVPEFVRILDSVGISVGKIGIERPLKLGYKTPMRFAIKMQSWVDSGARFNIARKQKRVDEWAATHPTRAGCASERSKSDRKTMQYQTLRSGSDNHVFVVCRDGTFYEAVPHDVRRRGPWQVQHRGELANLNTQYLSDIEEHGYALVRCEVGVFKPDV